MDEALKGSNMYRARKVKSPGKDNEKQHLGEATHNPE